MKKIVCITSLLLLFACGSRVGKSTITLVEVPTVYNWKGAVKADPFDASKKKIINYFGYLNNFRKTLEHTDRGKIDRIIRENPGFQFVFYIDRIKPEDTVAFKQIMREHQCAFPVILDFKEDFYNQNKKHLFLQNARLTGIGYICDEACRVYGISVIGTRQSFFDQEFRKAKREMR